MTVRCLICEAPIAEGARVVRFGGDGVVAEACPSDAGRSTTGTRFICERHEQALSELRSSAESAAAETAARDLRAELYQELDLLAFALEMEASEAAASERDDEAERAQLTRLGIRLAQRLVSGVFAPEVNPRLSRWRSEYESRFPS